jgi:hypothetical protein
MTGLLGRANLALTLVLLATGCGGASSEGYDGETWVLADRPELELGSGDFTDEGGFFRVRDVRLLSSGDVLVVDGGSRELRWYSPAGELVRSLGRSGEGPGEFRSLAWAMVLGDTAVVAFDAALLRLTLFSLESGETRTWTVAATDSLQWATVVRPFPDLALVVSGNLPMGESAEATRSGRVRPRMAFAEYGWNGEPRRTLVRDLPGMEFFQGELGSRRVQGTAVFPRVTVASPGSTFLVVAANEGPFVTVVDRSSGEVREVRWQQELAPVERRHVEFFIDDLVGQAGTGEGASQLRQMLEQVPVLEHFPWYDQMVVSDRDEIWIREYPVPGSDEALWRVVDVEGSIRAVLTMPIAFEVKQVKGEYLAGVWVDALGVERVRIWRVLR